MYYYYVEKWQYNLKISPLVQASSSPLLLTMLNFVCNNIVYHNKSTFIPAKKGSTAKHGNKQNLEPGQSYAD